LADHVVPASEVHASLEGIAAFLQPPQLIAKLQRELGSKTPFAAKRLSFKEDIFECWAPLGLLVHVSPTNALSVGVLSVIEGLLTGNVNVLKTSGKDSLFPQQFFEALINADRTG